MPKSSRVNRNSGRFIKTSRSNGGLRGYIEVSVRKQNDCRSRCEYLHKITCILHLGNEDWI